MMDVITLVLASCCVLSEKKRLHLLINETPSVTPGCPGVPVKYKHRGLTLVVYLAMQNTEHMKTSPSPKSTQDQRWHGPLLVKVLKQHV